MGDRCTHYWCYPHSVYSGRSPNEVAIVRYCDKCKKVQMSFTKKWVSAHKKYDLSDDIPFITKNEDCEKW